MARNVSASCSFTSRKAAFVRARCPPPCRLEGTFQLVILGRGQEQLVDRRWQVVHRWRADLNDAAVRPDLISRSELQASPSIRIDDDRMKSIRGYVDIYRLQLATVASREQGCFAAAFREQKNRFDGELPHGIRSGHALVVTNSGRRMTETVAVSMMAFL